MIFFYVCELSIWHITQGTGIKRLIGKHAKYFHFFSELSSLTSNQVNVLSHLLCLVTYVTALNKCSNLVVKPAKSRILKTGGKVV